MSTTLQEIGPEAVAHRDELEEVKRRLNIRHDFFDCWIYGFLENKKYDIEETVSKLQRREQMERNELASYDITDYMRETMAKGIIQLIGDDKEGRVTFYIVTRRDFPTSKRREENKRNFDMWLTYGTRLRKENRRCRITMLINQKDASMWSNTDMTFQADVALRIAKYYPGAVDRMYITKMSNTLATMAKPIFARLPSIVSDRIRIFTESDIEKGKLLELFDENVLPVDLGGKNDCDGPKNWSAFANTVESHFTKLKEAVAVRGLNVKEWELECLQQELAESAATSKEKREAKHMLRSTRRGSTFAVASSPQLPGNQEVYLTSEGQPMNFSHVATYGGNDERDDKSDDLHSCISEDDYAMFDENVRRSVTDVFGEPEALGKQHQCTSIVASSSGSRAPLTAYGKFMLEEERRWRHAIACEEAESRLLLIDRRQDSYQATTEDVEDVFGTGGSRRLASFVPAPARSMLNFFLQCCCVLSAVYFAAATVFCASIACSVVVTFFFGMFADPKFVFPVGVAMLLAGVQGAMICSRGLELTRLSYYGRLLPGFRNFGMRAQAAQLLFTFALILTQFIIFVVYAVQWDTLNGLKVAFATGWLSGTILVALHHILYWLQPGDPTEWVPLQPNVSRGAMREVRQRGTDTSKGALPIYLLFDLTEDDEEESPAERTSGLLLVLLPVLVSLIVGVAFLVSKALVFAVATPIATLTASWALNAYVDDATQRYHAVPTKFVTWFAAIAWLFNCYTFGFRDYTDRWATPVIVVSVICAFFIALAALSHKRGNSSRVLRIALLAIVGYTLGCVIMCFVVVHWSLGVFTVVMALHNGLCLSRNSGHAITLPGRFIVSAGTALVLIACVMLGWIGTTHLYSVPRSAGSTPVVVPPYAPPAFGFSSFLQTPLCSLQLDAFNASTSSPRNVTAFPPATVLDALLLTELSGASSSNIFDIDFNAWFLPGSVSALGVSVFPSESPAAIDFPSLKLAKYVVHASPSAAVEASAQPQNVTVYVLQSPEKIHSLETMVVWAEAISLSPLSIFLPMNWTKNIIHPYSFSTFMVPFPWREALDDVTSHVVADILSDNLVYGSFHRAYIVGYGVAGGLAQIAGPRAGTSVIAFNAPGVRDVLEKFSISVAAFNQLVLTISANDAALSTIGGDGLQNNFEMNCGYDADTCQSLSFLARSLIQACEPTERAHA